MMVTFFKYQGCGNDFVMIDNRSNHFPKEDVALINKICNRRFGIGADGLILLENESGFDFRMVYFNADGNESSMCGNGGRCIVAFAKKLGIIKFKTSFVAIDGPHHAEIDESGMVSLGMLNVNHIEEIDSNSFVLNTGSPHYVVVKDSMPDDILKPAKEIRYNARFEKDGINVNFIKLNNESVDIRTYERGVEDETLACGTGSVAAAMIASKFNRKFHQIVNTLGGKLEISFDNSYQNVFLKGPAIFVFQGSFSLV